MLVYYYLQAFKRSKTLTFSVNIVLTTLAALISDRIFLPLTVESHPFIKYIIIYILTPYTPFV